MKVLVVRNPAVAYCRFEQVDDAREHLEARSDVVGALDVDQRVAADPAAAGDEVACGVGGAGLVGVVLVAVQVGAGSNRKRAAEIERWRQLVVERQLAGMARHQWQAVARPHQDVAVGIGAAVGFGAHLEGRLECGVDQAIAEVPVQPAGLATERQVESLAARGADVVEVAGIGGGGYELDVVPVHGAEQVGAPVQPLA